MVGYFDLLITLNIFRVKKKPHIVKLLSMNMTINSPAGDTIKEDHLSFREVKMKSKRCDAIPCY